MRVSQRGRAILRQISAHDAMGTANDVIDSTLTFRPGDFLLTSSNGWLARLQGVATLSKINHAAVIVDTEGTIIEANPSLFCRGERFRTSSVRHYVSHGHPCWIGYVEVLEGSRQEVVGYAQHLLQARGGGTLSGRFWLLLQTVCSVAPRTYVSRLSAFSPLRGLVEYRSLVMREDLCYSSGELVARSLERGGFIWEHDPALVTPADIFLRYRQPVARQASLALKSALMARETYVAAPARAGKLALDTSPSKMHGPQRMPLAETSTADLTRAETRWQVVCGIGAATIVGLLCVDLLEHLMRSLRRQA
jgi:hypothetical protein